MFNLTASSRAARAHVAILTVSLVSIFFFCTALVSTRVAHAFRAASTSSAVAARSDQVVLSGYVVYTTGEPAKGINVVMSGARSGATVTDGGGHYEFTVDSVCGAGVVINFTASSDEIVDGAPLTPAEANISGCIVTDHEMPQMTMFYPKVILFDGYVRDTTGAGVSGVTVTIRREKYDLNPPAVETSTTTTGADGRYFYPSYARCSVDYTFTAALAGATIVPPSVGFSGCILQDFTVHEFTLTAAPTPPDANSAQNDGRPPCNSQVGEPVNVTNGNVYLDQTDYHLPGIGSSLEITRSYNSDRTSRAGLFGRGWTTALDESIETVSSSLLRLNLPDGRAVLFDNVAGVFTPRESANFHARLTRDSSGTFTLTTLGESVQRFDASGKLTSTADRYGNLTLLTYDANGGLASVNDPSGRRLSVESDGSRRVVALSDSLGVVATYSYGAGGELLSVNYPDGSGFHFNYTPSPAGAPLLTSVTDALGETVEAHTYDARGRAVSSERDGGVERTTILYVSDTETDATDARGHVTKFFIDRTRGRNVVTRVEGACSCGGSQVQSWTYDAAARQTSATNALGQRTDYTYDTDGNLLTITDALGRTSYTYNARGQVLTATDASGATTFNTYDPSGKLIARRDANGNATTFAYDARSLLTNFTDARSHTLSLAYDSSGNLTRAVDAAGNATTYTYDARSRLTGERDALGGATAYEYDAVNRPTKITRADGATINLSYDDAGRLIKANDPRGLATAYAYDGAGRLITVTDAAGGTINYGYDQLSNLTSMTDELGRTTDYEYDEFRRLTRATYPAAEAGAPRLSESFEHDALGNILRVTDTAGRATSFDYDAASRVVRVTDPLLQATRYDYDALSRVTAVTDALGQRYNYSYDALSRVTRASRAGASVSFAYDAVGNLSRRTDYAGATTAYDYDELDRLTRISYPDASVSVFEYDALSRLTAATNRAGTVRFAYDALSRLASTTDVFGQTLAYAYDADGNRTSMSVNNTPYLSYQYDALNRLTRETDAAGAAVTYSYDAASRQTARTLPNGVATAYAYDDLNRLTRLTDSAGAGTLSDRQYSYDAASNLTQSNESAGASTFSYDALDRIVAAAQPSQSAESYAYDAVGNRTRSHRSATYAYQPFNRLTATGAAAYAYDADGNIISKTDGVGATDLSWDAANRLTGVRLPDGSAVAYAYDALGRRVSTASTDRRNRRTTTTSYTYDGSDVLRETDDDGHKPTTTDYLRGAGTDDLLRQTTRAQHGHPATYYHLADRQGSTRLLTDERARVAARLDYDTFGDGTGSPLTRYAYTGRERDDQTGIYYYRARWYDPQLGRFLSEDPIGLTGGINLYSYVHNNPVGYGDPSGLFPTTRIAPGFGGHVHQNSIERVLSSILPPSDIINLQEAQKEIDTDQNEFDDAYKHAMTPGDSDPMVAMWKANSWVRENLRKARCYDQLGDRRRAMRFLGFAIHTLQDHTSPAHHNFARWYNGGTFHDLKYLSPEYMAHMNAENFDPGSGSQLDLATERGYKYFTGELPIPDNFFQDLGVDAPPWYGKFGSR